MDPITGAVIGGAITGGTSFWGSERANEANQASANKQMRHQRWMSENAHRMEVKDLRAAGLNPILSANSGASAGAGAQAQNQNSMEGASTAALDVVRLRNEIKRLESETDLNTSASQKQRQDARTSAAQERLTEAQTTTAKGDPRNMLGTLREAITSHAPRFQKQIQLKTKP